MSDLLTAPTLLERMFDRHAPDPRTLLARAQNPALEYERMLSYNKLTAAMLALPAVALPTLRYSAPPARDMHPTTRGMVTEISMRLALHRDWQDGGRSAWYIATELQEHYVPTGTLAFRRNGDLVRRVPKKALAFIAATDHLEVGGLAWHCEVPRADDPYDFETVRLKDAIARFEPGRSG